MYNERKILYTARGRLLEGYLLIVFVKPKFVGHYLQTRVSGGNVPRILASFAIPSRDHRDLSMVVVAERLCLRGARMKEICCLFHGFK